MAHFSRTCRSGAGSSLPVACAIVAALPPSGQALAQTGSSRPVVQQAPPASLAILNSALKDLSRNPGDVAALVRAGWASLDLDDAQSAEGFFRRAVAIQPQNGEVKAGLATAAVRQDDPVTAVQLFSEAEAAGAPMVRYAADRGLALDLVGNNTAAQQSYRHALAYKYDAETVRRLALSQAIAGDQASAEATLLPLLQNRDLAGYRTRAFALAILGKGEDAVVIAQTMLPPQISGRMAPYLRYMPRLTRAQQAAAANLGQFPPASEIGQDSPAIAAISAAAAPKVAAAAPDSRLVPSGEPLGRKERRSSASRQAEVRAAKVKTTTGNRVGTVEVTYSSLAPPASPPPAPVPQAAPPVQRVAAAVQPPLAQQMPQPPVSQATPPVQALAAAVQAPSSQAPASKPVLVASLDPQPSSAPPATPLEQVLEPAPAIAPQPKQVSLAEAFADFAAPTADAKPAAGAVDLSKLKPARGTAKSEAPKPAAPKAKPKPKAPANPQRFWAQVATGRDVDALAFDWRRLQREGGKLLAAHDPYTAKWGRTRRLLTGPYKTEDEADKAVAALKKKGIDAFEFTSDEGEEVTPLS